MNTVLTTRTYVFIFFPLETFKNDKLFCCKFILLYQGQVMTLMNVYRRMYIKYWYHNHRDSITVSLQYLSETTLNNQIDVHCIENHSNTRCNMKSQLNFSNVMIRVFKMSLWSLWWLWPHRSPNIQPLKYNWQGSLNTNSTFNAAEKMNHGQ